MAEVKFGKGGVMLFRQSDGSLAPLHTSSASFQNTGFGSVSGLAGGSADISPELFVQGREKTITYKILRAHGPCEADRMRLKFDALVSHDITYVGIIQTARVGGMTEFPVPYALTNCHNSLCAVGGTINADDHAFGLSAARKYGGIFVPANQAVIHQFAREKLAGCGKMILGSDSHTRYGCYGTLGIGEGGGELVRQLLKNTYDIETPDVVLVWLEGSPGHGIGPHDVALSLVRETFAGGKVKNRILEFAGPGVGALSMDFRAGIDVMTTETGCLSSIWETDDRVRAYYDDIGKPRDFSALSLEEGAYYDSAVRVDLSAVRAMIALPFHPSKAVTIHELQREPARILREAQDECNRELNGRVGLDLMSQINNRGEVVCQQGVIVGCAGGMFDNINEAADILRGKSIGSGDFELSVYPSSIPVSMAITRCGLTSALMESGALIKPAFCGPCFGAGDTPAHNTLSVRHATRNFANREGSKPSAGQIAAVALMDARSIAATAVNGGLLTAATDIEYFRTDREYSYDGSLYEKRCYFGFGKPDPSAMLRFGPNITDWPEFHKPEENMLLKLCVVIRDEVTTTDELIPSGETSSYRSNPVALAEFTLSRRAPGYVAASKAVRALEEARRGSEVSGCVTQGGMNAGAAVDCAAQQGSAMFAPPLQEAAEILAMVGGDIANTSIGSCIFAKKPGDGSAREQAASCQRILGGLANICYEYATKRYRSNCINWGIVPFTISENEQFDFSEGDWVYITGVRSAILSGVELLPAKVICGSSTSGSTSGSVSGNTSGDISGSVSGACVSDVVLECRGLSQEERLILTEGCLMNYYKSKEGSYSANGIIQP